MLVSKFKQLLCSIPTVLLLLFSLPVNAVSFDTSTNEIATNADTITWRHNVGVGADRKLIVGIGIENHSNGNGSNDVPVTGVTFDGTPLTRIGISTITNNNNIQRTEVWYLDETDIPNGNRWIVVNTTGNVEEISAGAISLLDAIQGSVPFITNTNNGQTTISTDITTTVDNSWVLDVVSSGNNRTFTQGSGQIERWDTEQSGNNSTSSSAASTKVVINAGTTTMTQTQSQSANRLAHVVIAIAPMGAGGGGGGGFCFADEYGIYAGDSIDVENNSSFENPSAVVNTFSIPSPNPTTTSSAVDLSGDTTNQTTTLTALPSISWVNSPNSNLSSGAFAPGDYNNVAVNSNANITLSAGIYNLDQINLGSNVTITLSSGPVIINTNEFRANINASINNGGDPADLTVNIYNDNHDRRFDLGDDSDFTGVVYSSFSNTVIQTDDDNNFTGAILTNGEVQINRRTTFRYTPAAQSAAAAILDCNLVPTVDTLSTPDTTPTLTGTYDSANTVIFTVTVAGTTYTLGTSPELTASGDNWSLAVTSPIANGTYDIEAVAIDGSSNTLSDLTTDELFIGIAPCFTDSYGIYVDDQLLIENNITFSSASGTSTLIPDTTNQSAVALDGTVSNQTTTLSPLPAISWVTSPDPDLNNGDTLAPGNYDRVRAENNATITLQPGTYNIDELNLRRNVTIIINPVGPVTINTNEFTANGDATINAVGDPANLTVNIYNQHSAEFDLGDDSNFTGVVYSSFASTLIEIDDDNTFTGAIITAGDVELKDNSTVNYTAAAQAAAASLLQCVPSGIHHIEFIHDGSGLTCNPEQITIKACADNAVPCTPYTSAVTVDLLPTGWGNLMTSPTAWTAGDSVTFTNATGSVDYYLQHTTAEAVTLDVNTVTPAASSAVICRNNASGPEISCTNTLDFKDSGFIFDVPTQTSCVTSPNITISAVRKSPTTEQCVPFFGGKDVPLKLWTAYTDPATGSNQAILNYSGTDYLLDSSAPGTDVTMTFDNNGQTTFTLNYPDAGELNLNTTYTGSVATSDAGLSMSGNQTYITVPAKLYVYSDDANATCATNNASCSAFKPAGNAADSQFNLKVRAACADNSVTPNFALNNIAITHSNTAPAGINGDRAVSSFDMAVSDAGEHTISNQALSEVGVFTFTATALNYLGVTGPSGTSTYIGRFYPHHFDTTVAHSCGTFTYSGQNFTVTTTAQNNWLPTPTATQNYTDTFAFNTTLSNAGDTSNFNGTSVISNTSFFNGTASKNDVTYTFPVKNTIPEIIVLRANDADTSSAIGITEGTTEIRSGRSRLENTFGSELTDLSMPLRIEYYSDNTLIYDPTDATTIAATQADDGFILNTDDSCTTYDATAGTLTNYTGNLSSGETTVTGAITESSGILNITFGASGAGNEGAVTLLANNISNWLTYNWSVDCDNADGDGDITTGIDNISCGLFAPFATASFGLYRGDDRIIYMREVFE